ncbi:cupin domain-containing protein [Saccharopolyspora sp. K220]|uniref:cupin domain-containing protein n=1 Tax=Saccharopolyspora soli TaxID=2926618 RepID=UPI001F5A551F|nr:cupin domain-containing protein [Saccharopolyspora soli]MCI2419516.1 cupin domain-containing protein [Saccharopolyspora soli]
MLDATKEQKMTTQHAQSVECRSFDEPDEVREFEHGRIEVLNMAGGAIGRLVLHPGWQWSQHVKPIVGTEWCEAPHFQYHVGGTIHVQMSDGTEFDAGPGSVSSLPQGHDAWVVGNDDVILIDWYAASDYAKQA